MDWLEIFALALGEQGLEPFTTERFFFLSDDDEMMKSLVDDFSLWGLPIHTMKMEAVFSLKTNTHEVSDEIIMIRLKTDTLITDISRLRVEYPTAGIVVQYVDGIVTTEQNSLLFLAGADICFDERARGFTVLASIQALRRRGIALQAKYLAPLSSQNIKTTDKASTESYEATTEENKSPTWELSEGGWRLLTPKRQLIALTGAERHALMTLFKHSPDPVSREQLYNDQTGTPPPKRYIDVVISRLKRKISQYGENIPIHSVWGVGYVFPAD
ncbi:winged helix-turn-helix domain-containing protein [Alcaligenes endophyticus]|uniref:Winged helix-turn-helix domain-containing protein n=1 Tax=Alcaligenes endophyticus TaxID=1929088 RepID=A0ABT8EJQ5_9BURK|nr:winged helix-turn-helix domain-containing protein [Alcaligenes endophyticus]MCX5592862.1 winged helix-turn-helix domain-containing protein [Alcaligenes endophyticus]MDN4121529.1 winged helix-turn-helix domain-containing protein [Alcaligenes endophyticus]